MSADMSTGGRSGAAPQEPSAVVLVIEDEPQMRRLMVRALSRKYRVIEAENGRHGIEALKRHAPDVVITDIIMPDKDGIETIREIQEMARGTKIIAISGGGVSGSLLYLDAARAFGVDAVLAKPFALERLMSAVEALLRPTLH